MRIKWHNLIFLALIIFGIVLVLKMPRELGAVATTVGSINQVGYSEREQLIGFLVYGLLLVLIVAFVKIAVNKQDKDRDG